MKIMSVDEYMNQVMSANGPRDTATLVMERGIVILAEDGRPLYELRLLKDGVSLEMRASHHVKVGNRLLETTMTVRPHSSNVLIVSRPNYE